MYQLISDGGTMTVGRRTASYVWGEFQVTLNDGLEQAEPADDRLTDAFIYRPDDRGTGRAELTFVRADAQVDMNAEKSDLEQTLDGASRRTEGEAFYTREISGLGLGRTKPGVHYVVGDLVNVLLWGRRMTLPVSAINAVSTDSDPAGWSVQVGGQMLRDAEAQRKRNSQIDVQIAREKRQRLKEAGQIRDTANSAASGVKDLNETLAGPDATSDDVLSGMVALAEQMKERGEEVPESLFQAYMYSNNLQWQTQEQVNAANEAALQSHSAAIEANQQALRALSKAVAGFLYIPGSNGTWADERISVTRAGSTIKVTALGRWRGKLAFSGSKYETDGGPSVVIDGGSVPKSDGTRVYTFSSYTGSLVHYSVNPGVLEEQAVRGTSVKDLPDSVWDTLMSWTAPEACTAMFIADWDWAFKTFGGDYFGRILIAGVDKTDAYTSYAAPLFGDGQRHAQVSTAWVEVPAGATVQVQGQVQHGNPRNRRIYQVDLKIISVEEN